MSKTELPAPGLSQDTITFHTVLSSVSFADEVSMDEDPARKQAREWLSRMLSLTCVLSASDCHDGSCHPQDPDTRKGERAHHMHLFSLPN